MDKIYINEQSDRTSEEDVVETINEEIGEDYETWANEDEEEDPQSAEYIIEGSEEELKAIKILFDTLNSQFGTPDLVDGVYIPLGVFMQTLVGSPYYEGNILTLEEESPNKLILTAELNKPFALLFALREAFSNLKIAGEIEKVESKQEENNYFLSLRDGSLVKNKPVNSGKATVSKEDAGFKEEDNYYIPFEKDGLWGYRDKNDNVVIEPKFDFEDADVTFEGVSRVKKNGLYGYFKIPSCEWLKDPQFKYGYRSPDNEGFVQVTLQ